MAIAKKSLFVTLAFTCLPVTAFAASQGGFEVTCQFLDSYGNPEDITLGTFAIKPEINNDFTAFVLSKDQYYSYIEQCYNVPDLEGYSLQGLSLRDTALASEPAIPVGYADESGLTIGGIDLEEFDVFLLTKLQNQEKKSSWKKTALKVAAAVAAVVGVSALGYTAYQAAKSGSWTWPFGKGKLSPGPDLPPAAPQATGNSLTVASVAPTQVPVPAAEKSLSKPTVVLPSRPSDILPKGPAAKTGEAVIYQPAPPAQPTANGEAGLATAPALTLSGTQTPAITAQPKAPAQQTLVTATQPKASNLQAPVMTAEPKSQNLAPAQQTPVSAAEPKAASLATAQPAGASPAPKAPSTETAATGISPLRGKVVFMPQSFQPAKSALPATGLFLPKFSQGERSLSSVAQAPSHASPSQSAEAAPKNGIAPAAAPQPAKAILTPFKPVSGQIVYAQPKPVFQPPKPVYVAPKPVYVPPKPVAYKPLPTGPARLAPPASGSSYNKPLQQAARFGLQAIKRMPK